MLFYLKKMKSYKTVNQPFMLKMAVFWQQKTAIKFGGKAFFSYLCASLIVSFVS